MANRSDNHWPPKRPRRCPDRVELDVGGTVFSTSISTLTSNSTYFQRLFSDEWRRNADDEADRVTAQEVFLDQDPVPFAVLLSFMRLGCVDVNELSREVLLQADFLGLEKLLAAVKISSYLHTYPSFDGSEEEICAAFDNEFGDIKVAVVSGLLPGNLLEKKVQKEFAHILIPAKGWYLDFPSGPGGIKRIDCMVSIVAPSCQPEESTIDGIEPGHGRRYSSFIDALNYLGRRGFTKHEKRIQADENTDDSAFDRMSGSPTFSRIVYEKRDKSNLCRTIFYGRHKNLIDSYGKEYASIIQYGDRAIALAGTGSSEIVSAFGRSHHPRSGTSIDHSFSVEVFRSEIDFADTAAALDWLHNEAYLCEEEELSVFFTKKFNKQWNSTLTFLLEEAGKEGIGENEETPFKVIIFSRNCQRRTDNNMN